MEEDAEARVAAGRLEVAVATRVAAGGPEMAVATRAAAGRGVGESEVTVRREGLGVGAASPRSRASSLHAVSCRQTVDHSREEAMTPSGPVLPQYFVVLVPLADVTTR